MPGPGSPAPHGGVLAPIHEHRSARETPNKVSLVPFSRTLLQLYFYFLSPGSNLFTIKCTRTRATTGHGPFLTHIVKMRSKVSSAVGEKLWGSFSRSTHSQNNRNKIYCPVCHRLWGDGLGMGGAAVMN